MRFPTVITGLVLAMGVFAAPDAGVPGAIQWSPEEAAWHPGPPNVKGAQLWVLEGDPKREGIFTLRIRVPAGFELPLHTHPQDERVTVLEGAVSVALGVSAHRPQGRAFSAGSFYVTPKNVPHVVWSEQGALLQMTGLGPWEVHAVTADRAPKKAPEKVP